MLDKKIRQLHLPSPKILIAVAYCLAPSAHLYRFCLVGEVGVAGVVSFWEGHSRSCRRSRSRRLIPRNDSG